LYISKEVGCGTYIPNPPLTRNCEREDFIIEGLSARTDQATVRHPAPKNLGAGCRMGRPMKKLPSSQETLVYVNLVWG
jgi:hypothetical protein